MGETRAAAPEQPGGNPWALDDRTTRWFRGNVHCHTTASDGRLSPQEAARWFAGAGYDFLAITDHNLITDPRTVDVPGLCLLPATELTAAGGELGASFHLIGLGLEPGLVLPPVTTPATEAVAWLHEQGAVVFTAHPFWSGLTLADLLSLPVAGIEIYNGGTVLDSQKGEALAYWDEGLARGARWWGIAVDDTHWHTVDRGLGWVVVRAAEPSPAALAHAMAQGHFYATSGPEIKRVSVAPLPRAVGAAPAGTVRLEVETSPCAAIYALGFGSRNKFAFDREAAARGEVGATITRATFDVDPETLPGRYVRLQCVDGQRRSAWSNPLFL
jgi:predicted metal-dependent phosphoesterase TrpH